MTMRRKDYKLIAEAIACSSMAPELYDDQEMSQYEQGREAGRKYAAHKIAMALKKEFPNFDRDKFIKASVS